MKDVTSGPLAVEKSMEPGLRDGRSARRVLGEEGCEGRNGKSRLGGQSAHKEKRHDHDRGRGRAAFREEREDAMILMVRIVGVGQQVGVPERNERDEEREAQ